MYSKDQLEESNSSLDWAPANWAYLEVYSTVATSLQQTKKVHKIYQQTKIYNLHKPLYFNSMSWKGYYSQRSSLTWCPQPKAMSFGLLRQMGQTCITNERRKKCHAWGGCEFICWSIYNRLLMHNHLTIICRIRRCAGSCIVSIRRSCPLLKTTARAIRSCVVSARRDCSRWGKRNALWGTPILYSASVFKETDFHVIISKHQTGKKQNKNNLHFELELLPQ